MTHRLVYNTSTLRIYVADHLFCHDNQKLDSLGITDAFATSEYQVVSRPRDAVPFIRSEFVSWGHFYIGDDELMYDARDLVVRRLNDLCEVILKIRDYNIASARDVNYEPRVVVIYDGTGRDSAMLAAAYFVIYRSGTHSGPPTAKVAEFQRIYFTPADKEDEVRIIREFHAGIREDKDILRFAELKDKLALKNLSFRVILDPTYKKNLFYD
jgi:hypothetical protein